MITISNLTDRIQIHHEAIAEILARPIETGNPAFAWMIPTTPDQQLASRCAEIAQHATRIIDLSTAIHALSVDRAVEETALGDFVVA